MQCRQLQHLRAKHGCKHRLEAFRKAGIPATQPQRTQLARGQRKVTTQCWHAGRYWDTGEWEDIQKSPSACFMTALCTSEKASLGLPAVFSLFLPLLQARGKVSHCLLSNRLWCMTGACKLRGAWLLQLGLGTWQLSMQEPACAGACHAIAAWRAWTAVPAPTSRTRDLPAEAWSLRAPMASTRTRANHHVAACSGRTHPEAWALMGSMEAAARGCAGVLAGRHQCSYWQCHHVLSLQSFVQAAHSFIQIRLSQRFAGMLRSMVRRMRHGPDRMSARGFHLGAGVRPPASFRGSAPAQRTELALTTHRHCGAPGCYSEMLWL